MSKMFMIVYAGVRPPRAALLQWMESQPRILNWHATTLYPLFVVLWDGNVKELSDALRTEAGLDNYVVVEAGADKFGTELEGWLPQATWEFIRKNESKVKTPVNVPDF